MIFVSVNPSFVKWGTSGILLNHAKILEHPRGINPELKQ